PQAFGVSRKIQRIAQRLACVTAFHDRREVKDRERNHGQYIRDVRAVFKSPPGHAVPMTCLRPLARLVVIAAAATGCDLQGRGAPSSGPPREAVAPPASDGAVGGAPDGARDAGPPAQAALAGAVAPLEAANPLIELSVTGYAAAVVSLPVGATARRPV